MGSPQLRAWNTADVRALEVVDQLQLETKKLLIVNDDFGALSVTLEPATVWTDSAISRDAIEANLKRNQLNPVFQTHSASLSASDFSGVVLKVPKQRHYFEYQLSVLAATLQEGVPVIAAGMDKHLFPQVAALLEQYIGPTERHRGSQKARAFSAIKCKRPYLEVSFEQKYFCEPLQLSLISLPNTFSREKLDAGSRLLLQQLKTLDSADKIVDLACGNGVLGIGALVFGIGHRVLFCDESAMAVESARRNVCRLGKAEACEFHHQDALGINPDPEVDLILCNPPFHSNHAVDESVGLRLITHSANYLPDGGRLCMVANRHLPYQAKLKRKFSKVHKLAENSKFIVWLGRK